MPESDRCTGKPYGQVPTVDLVIARVQRLCETPRRGGGHPLATHVEGYFLGDITAIVTAKLRSEGPLKR